MAYLHNILHFILLVLFVKKVLKGNMYLWYNFCHLSEIKRCEIADSRNEIYTKFLKSHFGWKNKLKLSFCVQKLQFSAVFRFIRWLVKLNPKKSRSLIRSKYDELSKFWKMHFKVLSYFAWYLIIVMVYIFISSCLLKYRLKIVPTWEC